jgi:hypothetical protein
LLVDLPSGLLSEVPALFPSRADAPAGRLRSARQHFDLRSARWFHSAASSRSAAWFQPANSSAVCRENCFPADLHGRWRCSSADQAHCAQRRLIGVGLGLVAVCPRLVLSVALVALIRAICVAGFCCVAGGCSVAIGSRGRAEVWITRGRRSCPGSSYRAKSHRECWLRESWPRRASLWRHARLSLYCRAVVGVYPLMNCG